MGYRWLCRIPGDGGYIKLNSRKKCALMCILREEISKNMAGRNEKVMLSGHKYSKAGQMSQLI